MRLCNFPWLLSGGKDWNFRRKKVDCKTIWGSSNHLERAKGTPGISQNCSRGDVFAVEKNNVYVYKLQHYLWHCKNSLSEGYEHRYTNIKFILNDAA